MLTQGNVRADCTVAVVDSCMGLVTGAVTERLGGRGKVICFYNGSTPPKNALEAYDFPQEVLDTIYHFPLNQVNSLKSSRNQEPLNGAAVPTDSSACVADNTADSVKNTNDSVEMEADTDPTEGANSSGDANSNENPRSTKDHSDGKDSVDVKAKKRPAFEDRLAARQAREREIQAARDVILERNIDCLIVASKFHPTPIVTALLEYVLPSRQLVVYSQFKEALMDCYVYLREHGGLVNYRLTETWLREYQVLPNRTHPVIQMSGTGGYLLTATTIVNEAN